MSHARAAASSRQGTRTIGPATRAAAIPRCGRSMARMHVHASKCYGPVAGKNCPGKYSLNGTPPLCHDDTPPGGGRFEAFAHTCHAPRRGVR